MNLPLVYKDPMLLVEVGANGYGDESVIHVEQLNGLFHQGLSQHQQHYAAQLGCECHVYLDIENPFVKANFIRLEGMYIVCNIFGDEDNMCWYKIEKCVTGQRKLLDNDVNNLHCYLSKATALPLPEDENVSRSRR